jgi:hypothetical protein
MPRFFYQTLTGPILDTGAIEGQNKSIESFEALSLERRPDIRLCVSATLPKDIKYLTLSHRWGDYPAMKLTNETLDAFHRSIPVSRLLAPEALTFKHYFEVTRCLGFRYLCINALCINQDDAQEKSREIVYMDEIYSNSSLYISATSSHWICLGLTDDPLYRCLLIFAVVDETYKYLSILKLRVQRSSILTL